MKFKTLALSLTCLTAYSQNTLSYSSIESHYNNGVELFEKRAYSSARKEFQNYINLSEKSLSPNRFNLANAEYYSAMSSLYSKALDADIVVERFVLNHGDHPKAKLIFSDLGSSYYDKGNYKEAIKYYEKALTHREDNLDTYEIRYQLGMSYYQEKDFDRALSQFDFVKGTVIENAVNAAYYAAVINLQKGNLDEALIDFKRVENVPEYKAEAANLIGHILFTQKRYDELLAYAEPIIANPNGRKYDNLAILAAEVSYFNDNFEKAALYYDKHYSLKTGKRSEQIDFRHAYSLYKVENYTQAAALFKNISALNNEIGQQSAYYLGICTLRQGDLNSALTAFDMARKVNFDTEIQEEASYNYIKVLVELGNNQQAIVDLQNYVRDYPDGKYFDETNELLSDILLETKNFSSAITYIEGLKRTTPKVDEAYQKIAYSQGVIEYNSARFEKAIEFFDKSLEKPKNADLVTKAKFLKAESLYQLNNPEAEKIYRDLTLSSSKEVRLKSQYALAYLKFSKEEYTEALRLFQKFATDAKGESSVAVNIDDANLRIGDSYLITKSYDNALKVYDDAFKNNKTGRDYALYQKGVAHKYLGQEKEAQSAFESLSRNFSDSRFLADASFQNGNLSMESGNYAQAINIFSDLIRKNPNSELIPHVLLRRGIAYSNISNYDKSISDFKLILDKYGNSKYASEAFLGIRESLSQANRTEEFFEIAEQYRRANPEGTSVQGLQFDAAKDLYFNENYDKAIAAFVRFKNQYPESVLVPEATFLIAEAYLSLNNKREALNHYQQIVKDRQLEYLGQAAMRSGNLYMEINDYANAVENFLLVVSNTSSQRENVVALEGLMKSYYNLREYDRAIETANKILAGDANVVIGAVNRAELFKGRAMQATQNFTGAKSQYLKTIALAKDEAAAEAKYRIGEMEYIQKQYDSSIKTMQELANDFSDFLIWYENAFLLIADNYIGKKDSFMAKATLNSIIENSESPEVVKSAKEKLKNIK